MRSQLAVTLMLVLGLAVSTSGVALGLTGSSGDGTAVVAQYQNPDTVTQPIIPPPTTPTTPSGPTTPTTPTTTPTTTTAAPPATGQGPTTATPSTPKHAVKPAAVQPVEQFAAVQNKPSASKLAFTGYNAIPIVIGGLVLLGLGLFMRRRQDSDPDS